jgi:hypothetical protein
LEGLGLNAVAKARANSSGVITVEDLTSFVKIRNPQLVGQYGGTASEIMSSESGPDFAIAEQPCFTIWGVSICSGSKMRLSVRPSP